MKPIWLLALALVAAPLIVTPARATDVAKAQDCDAVHATLPGGGILDLLDPQAPAELRRSILEQYERLATAQACPEFAYTLGQLYRHGAELPGNLVEQDIARARELIQPMAEAGYLQAYADMAEMVQRHGEPREAMLRTQVYLHLVRAGYLPLLDPDKASFMRAAYNGHLLARAEVLWRWQKPAAPRKRVNEDLSDWLAAHPDAAGRVRDYLAGGLDRASFQLGTVRVLSGIEDCRLLLDRKIGAATATWIVEVLPSGGIGRTVLENFVPRAEFAEGLRPCLDQLRFDPPGGERPRAVRINLYYGSPEGARLRR